MCDLCGEMDLKTDPETLAWHFSILECTPYNRENWDQGVGRVMSLETHSSSGCGLPSHVLPQEDSSYVASSHSPLARRKPASPFRIS